MEAPEQDEQTNPICEPGSKPPARSEPIMMGLVIQCTGCEFLKKTTTKTTCCRRVVLIQNRTTLENTWKNNGIRTLFFCNWKYLVVGGFKLMEISSNGWKTIQN